MQPFRVQIPDDDLDDLRRRLRGARWPEPVPGAAEGLGIRADQLRELADYWRDGYDWRAAEAELNSYPQFRTEIDGLPVHFLHVRAADPAAPALILTHGWPGSIVEYLDLIGPLTDPAAHGGDPADAFHVVVPSLPGFGFSSPLPGTGWGVARTAAAWAELMRRLGHDRYLAQGTDFGAWVSTALGAVDREHVLGVHINFLITAPPADPAQLDGLTPDEMRRLQRLGRFVDDGSGYMRLQATRPVTAAYALSDSPLGQLAWIAEKFGEWTDWSKTPADAVDRDRLLTNVSLYWFTRTAASSAMLYAESAPMLPVSREPVVPPPIDVPTAVSVFPADPSQPLRRWAQQALPGIVQWTEHERGGHFPALEQPALLAEDLRRFARALSAH
ncbi:epoxide hydrolase family protein [Actinoplanes teichomyceticus]|uniref:Microsomal epoxide hydrolase n=1 Tax=Actinoplanes teichomyceticus TaxID=1867 RepID=A0A561WBX7_ACTTI|nr:epoxide hydrolase family protein [Actinoplanes teichomyceticus]TWG21343.1 microsomal epoxide hydrolase [Actinoplanes teichomyceticus]GIF16428.1 microsomal epoxide hydrolase [Actinoplanes teichomyceticus]